MALEAHKGTVSSPGVFVLGVGELEGNLVENEVNVESGFGGTREAGGRIIFGYSGFRRNGTEEVFVI